MPVKTAPHVLARIRVDDIDDDLLVTVSAVLPFPPLLAAKEALIS